LILRWFGSDRQLSLMHRMLKLMLMLMLGLMLMLTLRL
jgi:hypothetical protein